jgi:hypothetical protein
MSTRGERKPEIKAIPRLETRRTNPEVNSLGMENRRNVNDVASM